MTRFYQSLLTALLIPALIYSPLLIADQLPLPSGDLEAPEVSHHTFSEAVEAGNSQSIKATVTDNVGVKAVTLFYRNMGAKTYKRLEMRREAGTDIFAATLGNNELSEPGVEYYIQAVDLAGNSLLHGYSFSPMKLSVNGGASATAARHDTEAEHAVEAQPAANHESQTARLIEDDNKHQPDYMKWLYIGLGVLAVGALAGGGGGGGGDDEGTVTVSAPTP